MKENERKGKESGKKEQVTACCDRYDERSKMRATNEVIAGISTGFERSVTAPAR